MKRRTVKVTHWATVGEDGSICLWGGRQAAREARDPDETVAKVTVTVSLTESLAAAVERHARRVQE